MISKEKEVQITDSQITDIAKRTKQKTEKNNVTYNRPLALNDFLTI